MHYVGLYYTTALINQRYKFDERIVLRHCDLEAGMFLV